MSIYVSLNFNRDTYRRVKFYTNYDVHVEWIIHILSFKVRFWYVKSVKVLLVLSS